MELTEHENNRVLIVDDQPDIHDDFREMLRPNPVMALLDDLDAAFNDEPAVAFLPRFELFHAANGKEACDVVRSAKASNRPVAVAFVDIRMPPGIDGIETARRMRKIDGDIEIILMTAYTDKSLSEIIHDMASPHKLLYIRKPFSREEIQQITLSLVGKWNIERALAEKQRLLAASHQRLEAVLDATEDAMAMYDAEERLVFANRRYETLFNLDREQLKNFAPDVLTRRFETRFQEPGKEGRLLFDAGAQAAQDAVAEPAPGQRLVYRSTAPVRDGQHVIGRLMVYRDVSKEIQIERMKAEVLHLRAELGMTRSFDGIVGDSPGMREVYALMERAVESDITVLIRGESGTVPIAVSVRLIAATNKNLEIAVKAGDFRGDLFYRLAVFPIVLPALRERREDIPLLANHFLSKHAGRLGKSIAGISTAALGVLLQYDWPGNIRELENAVERAVLLETTETLQVGNFPPELSPLTAAQHDLLSPTTILPLPEVERQAIIHALDLSAHNVAHAAQALGINRATLYRKLKKYGLPAHS